MNCRVAMLLLACLLLAGCQLKIPPLRAFAKVEATADLPPVSNAQPLHRMLLPGSCQAPGAPTVAVIDVDGLLVNSDFVGLYSAGENPVSLFRERLDAAASDPCLAAVVLRINSPGGGVTASDVMWHDLQRFKARRNVPVVACLMDVGAGGAYYLATACDRIVAHPTSVTGGIGVILNVYNLQDAMAQFNILGTPVKAGENIDIGTPIKGMTEESKELLQEMADEFHQRFVDVVKQARPIAAEKEAFDGRVFTAKQALARNLIDEIGYFDDAVACCQDSAGCDAVRIVLYHRPNDPARTPYAITPNVPQQANLLPLSIPGLDRSKLPGFLYLWQADPTLERLSGR